MRKSTKVSFALASFGALAASYSVGLAAELPQNFSANAALGVPTTAPSSGNSNSASSSASASMPASSDDEGTTATVTTPTNTAKPTTTGPKPVSSSSAPAPAASASASAPAVKPTPTPTKTTTAASSTKTGAAIQYRYGTVELSVTLSNGTITAINLVKATATDGRARAFPMLVSAAISAQGSNFGNISGATFTTDAFKQALNSALGI